MQLAEHAIGVCSWSLKCKDLAELAATVRSLGLCHIQLHIGDLCNDPAATDTARQLFEQQQITLTAGMIGFAGEDYSSISTIRQTGGFVPDILWPQRLAAMESAARCAERLGMSLLSTHIGFVPGSNEAGYGSMVGRLQEVADMLAEHKLTLLMETGQEDASELLQFLNDVSRPNVAVNFDPANMILYGAGNPVEAVGVLGRHVRHVHIKDATASTKPGLSWGEEVPFGSGQVDAAEFLAALREVGYRGPLVIEREAGPSRVADVAQAIRVLSDNLGKQG